MAVPTERSIPPAKRTRVIPKDTIAKIVKLLTRILTKFEMLRNPGAFTDKKVNTNRKARTTVPRKADERRNHWATVSEAVVEDISVAILSTPKPSWLGFDAPDKRGGGYCEEN
jgi:hypothetical protein